MSERTFNLIIVGGGVTGSALAYVASKYTTIGSIALIEKNAGVAEENSHPLNNAQTSHDGGTETNYSLEHALRVKAAAVILRNYVESKKDPLLFRKTHRMVLGVGTKEVEGLKKRFEEFRDSYPDLKLIGKEELARIEPKVMEFRNPDEPVAALVSSEGYAINYQRLAEHLVCDAEAANKDFEIFFNTGVKNIRHENGMYVIETGNETFKTEMVVFAAGSYSLFFAHKLEYGKQYGILPVAGSFYSSGEWVRGKVYRVQVEGRPFAEIHGDPDVLNAKDTRFGPTTKPLPLMERHNYKTFFDFIKLPLASFKGIAIICKIIIKNKLFGYVAKNMIYDLPVIGKFFFLREARVIIPALRYSDLKLRRRVGGIRPQIVDLKTGTLQMGDATIVGDNIIFNTTPSPGASICLGNAKRDAIELMNFSKGKYQFDTEAFEKELG